MGRIRLGLLSIAIMSASGCAATYLSDIDAIAAGDAINQLSADSAPQQTVVNGWTARDYLELAARQNTEANVLMYFAVGALIVIAVTTLAQNRRLANPEQQLRAGLRRDPAEQ